MLTYSMGYLSFPLFARTVNQLKSKQFPERGVIEEEEEEEEIGTIFWGLETQLHITLLSIT